MQSNCPSYLGWLSILLTVLFVGLRLANIITWNWGFVIMPACVYAVGVLCLIIFGLAKEYLQDHVGGGNE